MNHSQMKKTIGRTQFRSKERSYFYLNQLRKQMKSLLQYILESENSTERGNIKFTIWEAPDKKVKWLNNNKDYQKIEYQYKDKKLGIEIDFLLGFKDNTWKLWIGKIGAISYDDDPWVDLDCDNFKDAILKCLDYTADFIEVVKVNKDNWVQFYI